MFWTRASHAKCKPSLYIISSLRHSPTTSALKAVATTWEKVKLYTTSDPNMKTLVSIIESGFPEFRHELPRDLHELPNTVDGVILYKDRVVIPPQLRDDILTTLHCAQQGVTSMIAGAETSVFWPGITPTIKAVRFHCKHYNRMTPSQPSAPPTPPVQPEYLFQYICADFFRYKGLIIWL